MELTSLMPTQYPAIIGHTFDPICLYVRDAETLFYITQNPVSQPRPNEERWPVEWIEKTSGVEEVEKFIKSVEEDEREHLKEFPEDGENGERGWNLHNKQSVIDHCEELIKKYGENYERPKITENS